MSRLAPPAPPATPPSTGSVFGLIAFLAIVLYAGALPIAIARSSTDVWSGMLLAPALVLLSLPILRRMRRAEDDPWIKRLLLPALLVKLAGGLVRYVVTIGFLGPADANTYHKAGEAISGEFRQFDFSGPLFQEIVPQYVGTTFIRLLTGIVYTVIGPTKLGGFLVFAWLGFFGLCFCYTAFRIAVPGGNHRLYAVLVFLLPSLVFWPSSIGKEAWMQLTIGLTAYGVALVLTHRTAGYLALAAGLWGTAMVRPHISLILFLALFVAFLIRRSDRRQAGPAIGKLVGIVVLVAVGAFLLGRVGSFFGVDATGTSGVDQVLTRTEAASGQGGSEFESTRPSSPLQFPWALITVVFRPFPFEAGSAVAFLAACEGVFLLFLFLRAPGRLLLQLRQAVRIPYAMFAITYSLMFAFGFSSITNFGILVRQRTQLLPFVLVLLALPVARAPADHSVPGETDKGLTGSSARLRPRRPLRTPASSAT
jgi:hypothetical protein